MSTLAWRFDGQPKSFLIYRKDYLPSQWSYTEQLDPLRSSVGQLTDIDPNCPLTYILTETKHSRGQEGYTTINQKETTDRDDLASTVTDLPAGQHRKYVYELNYPNYP